MHSAVMVMEGGILERKAVHLFIPREKKKKKRSKFDLKKKKGKKESKLKSKYSINNLTLLAMLKKTKVPV